MKYVNVLWNRRVVCWTEFVKIYEICKCPMKWKSRWTKLEKIYEICKCPMELKSHLLNRIWENLWNIAIKVLWNWRVICWTELETIYEILAEVPSVACVLNGLSVDIYPSIIYPILLLYPFETPVPFLPCRNFGSLLCLLACWLLLDSICKGLYSVKFDMFVAGYKWRKI